MSPALHLPVHAFRIVAEVGTHRKLRTGPAGDLFQRWDGNIRVIQAITFYKIRKEILLENHCLTMFADETFANQGEDAGRCGVILRQALLQRRADVPHPFFEFEGLPIRTKNKILKSVGREFRPNLTGSPAKGGDEFRRINVLEFEGRFFWVLGAHCFLLNFESKVIKQIV